MIDQYSGFDHKEAMAHAHSWLAPWIPKNDQRRQMSYVVANAIHENVSRLMVPAGANIELGELREYGDPSAYSSAIAGGVLGTDMLLVVRGADAQLPDQPVLPHKPEPPSDPDAEGVLAAAHAAQIDVWKIKSTRQIDDWKEAQLAQPGLRDAQEWLRTWAEADRAEAKLRELYKDVVQPCGDGLIALRVEPGKLPTSEIWDPESYFPDFPDGEVSEFADRVFLAYEFEDDDGKAWIRRVRYELVDLVVQGSGEIGTRSLPYPTTDGKQSTSKTCVMTDAYFKLDGSAKGVGSVYDLKELTAERYETTVDANGVEVPIRSLDLGIDFIPIIHFPSVPSSRTHFGRSVYLRGAQLFDDLAATDTSIMSAAGLAGNPPLVVSGAVIQPGKDGKVQMGPGKVLSTPEQGSISKLSMAEELVALMSQRVDLRERTSTVMQTPDGVMGQASAEKIASGITLALTFTPFQRLVMEGRLALVPKLDLYLKMVMRLAIVGKSPGWEKVRGVPMASIKLGSFMPTDMPGLVDMIVSLRTSKNVSRKVAATWLQAAGLEFDDIDQLLAELDAEDTEGALDFHAMFGPDAAARRLGIEFDAEQAEEQNAVDDESGLGAFGTSLDRTRARPQRPFEQGEDPSSP